MANRKPRNGYDRKSANLLSEHPFGNLVGAAMRLTYQEVTNTVMREVSDDYNILPNQRVERIFDLHFERQKPGTMIPAPTRVADRGRVSLHSLRLVSSIASSPTPG